VKPGFIGDLIVKSLPTLRVGRGEFAVYRPFWFLSRSGECIEIPAGFVTDLCSRPWFLDAVVPSAGPTAAPSVLHDFLLSINHPRAHGMFNEALEYAGFSDRKRRLMVTAVRLYDWCKR
jgi:hypothetical protein